MYHTLEKRFLPSIRLKQTLEPKHCWLQFIVFINDYLLTYVNRKYWLNWIYWIVFLRMDSYVLAETFKYLYLLFSDKEDMAIDIDNFVFTTEAHLLPLSLSVGNYSWKTPTRVKWGGDNVLLIIYLSSEHPQNKIHSSGYLKKSSLNLWQGPFQINLCQCNQKKNTKNLIFTILWKLHICCWYTTVPN